MTAASAHPSGLGLGGAADTGWIAEFEILAITAFHDVRLVAVGADVGYEAGGATPPTEATQIIALALNHFRQHQCVTEAVGYVAKRHRLAHVPRFGTRYLIPIIPMVRNSGITVERGTAKNGSVRIVVIGLVGLEEIGISIIDDDVVIGDLGQTIWYRSIRYITRTREDGDPLAGNVGSVRVLAIARPGGVIAAIVFVQLVHVFLFDIRQDQHLPVAPAAAMRPHAGGKSVVYV